MLDVIAKGFTSMDLPDASMDLASDTAALLESLGVRPDRYATGARLVRTPITGEIIGRLRDSSREEAAAAIARARQAYLVWRIVPAPKRGEFVRVLGEVLREHKDQLGRLVSIEVGKIHSEGQGEVQEMIDICDFAVGLSRQLHGLAFVSERPAHRMMEQWHPLGVVGVISAFNFPVAVWSWNAALAFVCGDAVVWKPSEKAPLTALAVQALFERAAARFGGVPEGLHELIVGGADVGVVLVDSPDVALVSATGSTRMGREVGPRVARRFGRTILELGGNNAVIACPSADLDLAVRAIAFSAVGTAGQRCTTLRRLIVHESIAANLAQRLVKVYRSAAVGNPLESGTLVGPLIDGAAFSAMQRALNAAHSLGATVTGGDRVLANQAPDAFYVSPALVEMPVQAGPMLEETFAPILYAVTYSELDEALRLHNAVPQGLSSAILTTDLREMETFLSAIGSDCGIANVNMGTSGAEIGGAFGGEKETGGGRESGSDAWKGYMRRVTSAINYGRDLPLAQGVRFDVE
jgi:aldehyde dehydrogenase (NAD+)